MIIALYTNSNPYSRTDSQNTTKRYDYLVLYILVARTVVRRSRNIFCRARCRGSWVMGRTSGESGESGES